MPKDALNIVWLKRDIRCLDHAPLAAAERSEVPYLILYLYEPSLMQYADQALRHWQFVYLSLKDMQKQLSGINRQVHIAYGEAQEVFTYLSEQYAIQEVFSHRESGTAVTWARDKKVKRLFLEKGIKWLEFQRDGIHRGLSHRKDWDKQWFTYMHQPCINPAYKKVYTTLSCTALSFAQGTPRKIGDLP